MLGNIATDRLTEDASFQMKTNKIIACKAQKNRQHTLTPTHPKRVTVWYRFWSTGIIGPFFFENEQGKAVTVNGDHYRVMLNEFLSSKIEVEDIWHYVHTAETTLDI